MRLSKILMEAVVKRLQAMLANKADDLLLTPEELSEIVEGISDNPNIQQWVLTNITSENAHLGVEIKGALKRFNHVKDRLQVKDLNSYTIESLLDLFKSEDDVLSKFPNAKLRVNPSTLSGVEVFYKSGPLTLYWVEEEEALKYMGEGSNWCTRGSFFNCKAGFYLENHGPQIIATYNNRLIAQLSSDLSAIKNLKNDDFSLYDDDADDYGNNEEDDSVDLNALKQIGIDFNILVPMILKKIEPKFIDDTMDNIRKKRLLSDQQLNNLENLTPGGLENADPMRYPEIFKKIIQRRIKLPRIPEVEDNILKLASDSNDSDAQSVFLTVWTMYCRIVNSRIPDLENAAVKVCRDLSRSKTDRLSVHNAIPAIFDYIKTRIGSRWFEMEPFILSSGTNIILDYAKIFFGDKGWPEANELILNLAAKEIDYMRKSGSTFYDENLRRLLRLMKSQEAIRPQAEGIILELYLLKRSSHSDSHWFKTELLDYAKKRDERRWPKFEQAMLRKKDVDILVNYCTEVIRERWPEAEEIIKSDPSRWARYRLTFNIKAVQ